MTTPMPAVDPDTDDEAPSVWGRFLAIQRHIMSYAFGPRVVWIWPILLIAAELLSFAQHRHQLARLDAAAAYARAMADASLAKSPIELRESRRLVHQSAEAAIDAANAHQKGYESIFQSWFLVPVLLFVVLEVALVLAIAAARHTTGKQQPARASQGELFALNLKSVLTGYLSGMPKIAELSLANLESPAMECGPLGIHVRSIVDGSFDYSRASPDVKKLAEVIGETVFQGISAAPATKALLLKAFPLTQAPGGIDLLATEAAAVQKMVVAAGGPLLSPEEAIILLSGLSNAWILKLADAPIDQLQPDLSRLVEEAARAFTQSGSQSMPLAAARIVMRFAIGSALKVSPYGAGDGSASRSAVVINTIHPLRGVAAQYQWICERFGVQGTDWREVERKNQWHKGRFFERFKIASARDDWRERAIFFDCTSFQIAGDESSGKA